VHLAPSCQDFSKSKIFYNWQKMASRKSKSEVEREKIIQNRCQELLKRMLQDEDNKYCVDCDAKGPRWVSWNLGIFVCIRCAGIHRNLGVHISKVKSVNLDSWTPQQVSCMQIMGNSRARAVYEANIPEGFRRPQTDAQLDTFIRAKYEKKKYIAREYIPQKAPDLPDGWTALIEAEKAKKDIRNIVLPSHTKASSNSDDSAKRERQSPKDVVNKSTTSSSPPKKASSSNAEKATLNSNFDLLSLNTSIPTKSAADKTSPKPTSISNIPTPKATATIANDLLCLGGETNQKDSEFDDFVKAATPSQSTTTSTSTNGTPATTTKDNSSNHFFDDFSDLGNASTPSAAVPEEKKTMSKDSIMALFNQKPSNPTVPNNPVNPLLQQQGFMPNNMGGMQIPANFGLGAQHPQNIQPQQPLVGGNGFGGGGNLLNNPFLAMSQPTSDPNNLFGNFAASNGNKNFLQ